MVIPVWDDYVAHLPAALASLEDQGVPVRLVVVDNASRVPVGEAALRLTERVSVGAARNAGLALVETPLVCFLDADDQLLPGTLQRMRARLFARPGCVAAVAACEAWVEGAGCAVAWPWPRASAYRLCHHPRLFAALAAVRNPYPTTGALVRTETLRAAGGFADANHEEDWLPAVTLAARGTIDLDARPGRRCRLSAGSLYGSGADLATMRANRRALRRALRRDPRTRRTARLGGLALAAIHLVSACVKSRPGRNGYRRLISGAGAPGHAAHRAHEDGHVAA